MLFASDVLEVECGCFVIPMHYIPNTEWAIKVRIKGRCVRFGCRVKTLQVASKSNNGEFGKTLSSTRVRRPDPLALALYQQ